MDDTPHSAAGRLVSRTFWAEAVSRLGDAVSTVAMPLTAVLVLRASPAELALIGGAQAVPILLLSIPVGAWVDRRAGRWPILLACDLGRAALLVAVPISAAAGVLTLPLLALVAFGLSVAGTFFDLAFAGWLPRLLRGDDLHRVNARVELARSAAVVIGPALGGGLVSALSAPIALLADAASFVASAVLIGSVRGSELFVGPASAVHRSLGRGELVAGLRFVVAQPYLRAVLATAGINNLARSIAMGVAILYLVDVAGLTAAEVGIAFALGNGGFLVGALIARRATAALGMGAAMQLGVSLFGPSMLVFALAPTALAGAAFATMLFANGLGISVHNVNQVTVRQIVIPDALRARAAAVFRLVIFGAIPVGTVIGGIVGEAFGLRAALVVSALGLFAGAAPYVLVRVTRLKRVEELQTAAIP
jgi:predicted MFS family arabinose efflux permease